MDQNNETPKKIRCNKCHELFSYDQFQSRRKNSTITKWCLQCRLAQDGQSTSKRIKVMDSIRNSGSDAIHQHAQAQSVQETKGKAVASESVTIRASVDNDVPDEDYNEPSSERTELLAELNTLLGNTPVSPVLWACLQVCDMSQIRDRINMHKQFPHLSNEFLLIPLRSLVLKWTQRSRNSSYSHLSTVSKKSGVSQKRILNSDGELWVKRSQTARNKCALRDNHRCLLTKRRHPQVAHIFPYSMLNSSHTETGDTPDFWRILKIFWDESRVHEWRNTIFRDPAKPNTRVDGCFNLLCLSPNAHDSWTRGLFALKPVELSDNRTELTVQFFWQVPGRYNPNDTVNLLTKPASSRGLECADGTWLTCYEGSCVKLIRSGDIFTFHTTDPDRMPLPSMEILEMQWNLQRLTAMCGAADWPELSYDNDDDSESHLESILNDDRENLDWKVSDNEKNVVDWIQKLSSVRDNNSWDL